MTTEPDKSLKPNPTQTALIEQKKNVGVSVARLVLSQDSFTRLNLIVEYLTT